MTRLTLTLVFALLLSAAQATELERFSTCKDLFSYMQSNALKRVGPYGLGGGFFLARRGGPELLATTSEQNDAPVEGTDFSGTNVQVQGVDEPDVVKTDGERVFALKNNDFYYVTPTRNGMGGKVVANITLPSFASEMLFYGDYVVVISQVFDSLPVEPFPIVPVPQPLPLASRQQIRSFSGPIFRSTQYVAMYKLRIVGTSVKLVQTLRIPGFYVSARLVGNTVRVVSSYDGSNSIRFTFPNLNVTDKQATEANKRIIRRQRLSTWLPFYKSTGSDCKKYPSLCRRRRISSCGRIYAPKEFSGFGILTVSTMRLSIRPLSPRGTSIVADGNTVYANTMSMYVATTRYQNDVIGPLLNGPSFKTSFHRFALSGRNVQYVASGEVDGSVLNQFSMHEFEGTFFIATTEGAPWWGSRDTSSSTVTALRSVYGTLRKISSVTDLGRGERIFAVRYIENTAYVVTFRQVDPLYIVDLSDPKKLVVTGELKIPGYSAYLHPIGNGRLLGVGRDATPEGRTTGAKVSLFDVSNPRNPIEVDSWTLEGSYSSAEWDHRAFLYWAPERIAVLPLSVFSGSRGGESFYGSIVLDIGGEISERGNITHICCGPNFNRGIRRNFVLGRANLWSLSFSAIQVNAIEDLSTKASISIGDIGNEGILLE